MPPNNLRQLLAAEPCLVYFPLTFIPHKTLRKFLKSKPGLGGIVRQPIWGIQKVSANSREELGLNPDEQTVQISVFLHRHGVV